tara:strand:- start:11614 stop:12204 length:591 start_codon:yes stop_codon:yes gene_type:complete
MVTQIGRLVSREYIEHIFSVHPLAKKAYLYSKQLNRQYNLDLLTAEAVQDFQAAHPLIAITSNKPHDQGTADQIRFYSNWVWLDLIKYHNIPNLRIIEVEESDVGDIAKLAWSYVASEELLGINRKDNFRELGVVLQRLTDESGSNPVCCGSKKITAKTIEQLSGETRAVIRGQQQKSRVLISGLENYISEGVGKN